MRRDFTIQRIRRGLEIGSMKQSPMSTPKDILDFWFEELTPKDWFNGGDAVDQKIRERFKELIEEVHSCDHQDWNRTPEGRLASIICLDQFPRNIYRGTAQAFGYDGEALKLAMEGIALGHDEQLNSSQRGFFYLPLEHSEDLEIQDRCMERFSRLVVQTPAGEEREGARFKLHYAWRHYEIIKRFGRYPHRNEALGRTSTEKEKAFLETPGSSF